MDRVGAHLAVKVPRASPSHKVGAFTEALVGEEFDFAGYVALCEGERYLGATSMETILASSGRARLGDLASAHLPVVLPHQDQEQAVRRAFEGGVDSVAVVDRQGDFCGFVPPRALMQVLAQEHSEDMVRLSGSLHRPPGGRANNREPAVRRTLLRLPWLIVGLLGALLAARVMSMFEAQLQARLVLAFFIPGVVYMADAVGTQTEALIVRGISQGVPVARVAGREVLTGVLVGFSLACVYLPFGFWFWGDSGLVLTIALTLFAACSTATMVGLLLPWLLSRLGFDPAFGSGPLATVIQDILSIVILFVIAGIFGA